MKIQLSDNVSTPIAADLFVEVVQSFWKGGGFFINLVTENVLDGAKSMVTPDVSDTIDIEIKLTKIINECEFFQLVEKYLIDKNAGFIFVESKALGPTEKLSVKTRRQLVNHLVDFMRHVYGKQIVTEHKISVAKAAIILFPCLKIQNSAIGGIVSFIFFMILKKIRNSLFYTLLISGSLVQSHQRRIYERSIEECDYSREKKIIW